MANDDKSDTTSKRGFASMSASKQKESREKSLATRKKNKRQRERNVRTASKKRKEADELIAQAEMLRAEADALDGQNSSKKSIATRNAKLTEEITEEYRDSVSAQYLKLMIQHAIRNDLTVDQLTTPSHALMDILNDAKSTIADRKDAIRSLQQYENAKPQMAVEETGNGIGSAQEEMDKLMGSWASMAPRDLTPKEKAD